MEAAVLVIVFLYFVPSIVAHSRRATVRGTVTVINIFLGWTIIGWVIALAMAFGPTEKSKPMEPGGEEKRVVSPVWAASDSGRVTTSTSPRRSIFDFLPSSWLDERKTDRLILLVLLSVLGIWSFAKALTIIGPRLWVILGAAVALSLIWWRGPWEKGRKLQISAVTVAVGLVLFGGWTGWLYVSDALEARTLAQQAQSAEKSGDYMKADNLYKRLLDLRKQDTAAKSARLRIGLLARSQSAFQQGLRSVETGQSTENSIAAFKRVAAGTPWHRDAQAKISQLAYEKGQQSLRAGQFKQAIQGFKGVAQGSPLYAEAQEGIRTAKARLTTYYGDKLTEAEGALADGYRPARDPARTRWGRVADAKDALADVDVLYLTPTQHDRYLRLKAETDRRDQIIAAVAERVTKRYLREQFAQEVEKIFLDKGMDVTATIEGRDKNIMRLKWVLWSRPLVYQWGKNAELIGKLRELGFSRIIFDTGFDERWWYDL